MVFERIQTSIRRKSRSLDHLPLTRRYEVRIADDKPELAALAERHIPGITNACETARRVHLHHRGSVLAVVRDERIGGAVACLCLILQGWRSFDPAPSPTARRKWMSWPFLGSRLRPIYAWALCLPAGASEAMGNVMQWFQRPLYRQADIFARPGTVAGMRFMRDTGFVAGAFGIPDLWIYQRRPRTNFEYFSLEPFQ